MNNFSYSSLVGDWQPPIFITFGCVLSIAIYLVGFVRLRQTRPSLPTWRATSFCAGILLLWLSLGSPLEEVADTVLTAHMIEHLLLMTAVPALMLLGWPTVPMLRGLPTSLRHYSIAPVLRWRAVRKLGTFLTRPVIAWLAMNLTLLLWHIPAAYDYALAHEGVHDMEHVCFLLSSLLFWWVLLRPWPSHSAPLGWFALLYLISADFVNTILSALLAFSGRPAYSFYLTHPNSFGLDAVTDQTIGACIMWVFGSFAFLLPAVFILGQLLQGRGQAAASAI